MSQTRARTTTLSGAIADALAAAGVRRVFGFPGGGSNLDVIEALGHVDIEFVLTRTETAAGFMAAAGAELTGVPGVVLVGNGPGVTSVATAVGHAQLDRVPLLVISDRYGAGEVGASGHQVMDQQGVLAPLTKLSETLEPETAGARVAHALELACTAPRGAVHLDLPRDISKAESPVPAPRAPAGAPLAHGDLEAIATALEASARPLVLVGLEAVMDVEPRDLIALVERLGAPVLSTYKGKGVFPERHRWFAGIITGGALEEPILAAADTVLAIGLDPVELFPRPWPSRPRVLSLRSRPGTDGYLRPLVERVGAIAADVSELASRVASASAWQPEEITAYRAGVLERMRLRPSNGVAAWEVVEAVRESVPDDALVTVDAGAHMIPAAVFWTATRPRHYLISNGFATMGFAVPAAIAAALIAPQRTTVAFTGDGGLAYNLAELETAARAGARLVVVVFNDASLSLIRVKQEASNRPRRPLDFGDVSFAAAAEAFGVRAYSATDTRQLRVALDAAVASSDCTLIDVRLSGGEYGDTVRVVRG